MPTYFIKFFYCLPPHWTKSQRLVFGKLYEQCSIFGKYYISLSRLAELTLCDRKTVRVALNMMESEGWIRIDHGEREQGGCRNRMNGYSIPMQLSKRKQKKPSTVNRIPLKAAQSRLVKQLIEDGKTESEAWMLMNDLIKNQPLYTTQGELISPYIKMAA